MKKRRFFAGIGALLLAPAPAGAAEPATGAATPEPVGSCEVHAWPSATLHTTYYGWFHGGTTDASLVGRKGYPAVPVDLLTAAQQAAAFERIDLAAALGLPGYRKVVHAEPLSKRAVQATVGRHAAGAPPCYTELLVESVVFQADYFNGKFLNVLFRLRRFQQGDAPEVTFGAFATAPLALALSGKDVPAPAELTARAARAFADTIPTFGTAARKAAARVTPSVSRRGESH